MKVRLARTMNQMEKPLNGITVFALDVRNSSPFDGYGYDFGFNCTRGV